jgi:hypothetical protein
MSSFWTKVAEFLAPPHRFQPNTRVNQVHFGQVVRADGVVLAEVDNGVVVEWARGGSSVVPARQLTRISS